MRIRLLLAAALVALAAPAAAWSHANLVRTEPANGAVLPKPPAAVRVTFDDVVQRGPGVEAIRNGGGSVLAGAAHVAGGRTLVVPLRHGLPDGDYSVRWSIISDDGHLESGVIAFAVGTGRPSPTAALTAEPTGPQPDDVAARWLFYAGILGAVGLGLFALVVLRRDEERIAPVISAFAVLAAAGAAAEAHRVGLSTRAGTVLGAGFLAALFVAGAAAMATRERRLVRPAAALAVGLAAVPTFAGHALDPGVNRVNVPADILHVAGAAAWIGALAGLVLFRDASRRRSIGLALAGVLVLAATGIVRASFELLDAAQLWQTAYGRTLLVKTGVLLLALAAGFALRIRIRRRAAVELACAAGIVVAVSFLVLERPGRNVVAAPPKPQQRVSVSQPSPPPPAPPAGAVVLAQEVGPLGVAVELEPKRVTAIVLSPAGGGLDGLDLRVNGHAGTRCGHGCYRASGEPGAQVAIEIDGFGPPRTATFAVPRVTRPAEELVRRAAARFRALRSVSYGERLASSATESIDAAWRLEKPNRVAYSIPGGAQGIVIGDRRWDRETPTGKWHESPQTPLHQPSTQWNHVANAHVVAQDAATKTVTFADPTIPAYFELQLDAKTLLPIVLHMTAAAHFMTDRYAAFNAPRVIRPPR